MTNKQLAPKVRAWLKSTDQTPDDARRSVAIVSSHTEHTPQRGRWLPLPSLQHSTGSKGASQAPPTPAQAPSSHFPTVTGRTRSMLSPVKAIIASVLVFGLGGAWLIVQPAEQQGSGVSGVESPFVAPVEVTGRYMHNYGSLSDYDGDVETLPGQRWVFTNTGLVSASDPRLEGTLAFIGQEQLVAGNGLEASERLTTACETHADCDEYGAPYIWLEHGAISIENDEGAWRQRPSVTARFPGSYWNTADSLIWVEIYDGEGAYDGLIAVLEFTDSGGSVPFQGFILDARQMPAIPENASTR